MKKGAAKRITAAVLSLVLCVTMAVSAGAKEKTKDADKVIFVRLKDEKKLLEIKNSSDLEIKSSKVKAQEQEGIIDLTLIDGDKKKHLFRHLRPSIMVDPELVQNSDFLYIQYTSSVSGAEKTVALEEEVTYEDTQTQYVIDDVYIRKEPNADSDKLGIAYRGNAVEIIGETPTHYHIRLGDVTGYSIRRCFTTKEEEAAAAVKAEQAARQGRGWY